MFLYQFLLLFYVLCPFILFVHLFYVLFLSIPFILFFCILFQRINPRHCHKTNDVAATVSSFVSLAEDVDDDTMREAIVNHGPLSAVMGVRAFRHYRSGVIYTDRCEAGYDHSISIVGFGTEGGQDYWIVKNSWGRDWGEDGYMRLARGKNLCGINDFASYPIV